MSQERLALMDGGKCILQVRGVRPFFSDKVDITQHEMYKELSDYDKKNEFDLERFVKSYGKMKVPKDVTFVRLDLSEVKIPDDLVETAVAEAGRIVAEKQAAALKD